MTSPRDGRETKEDRKLARQRRRKYGRARVRNFLFTVGPTRLSRGRIRRHYLAREIVVREVEATSPNWPVAFDGLRIGHVSDFHLGELVTLERALEAVDLLTEREPDFVACTGDVVDLHHHEAAPLLEALGGMGAPMGTALVLGNHDELHCPETIRRLATDAGIVALDDDALAVNRGDDTLVVAGIGWAHTAAACAQRLERTAPDGADILLAHNPRAFLPASRLGIPLTLSGHTHGGQVALPGRPNSNLALSHRHSAGLFESGPSRLYVTTGVGAWFPLRVNCPPEVVVVTMRRSRK